MSQRQAHAPLPVRKSATPPQIRQVGGIADLRSVTELYLDHNRVLKLPARLRKMPRLRVLDLSHNHIISLALVDFKVSACAMMRTSECTFRWLTQHLVLLAKFTTLCVGHSQGGEQCQGQRRVD